MDDKVTIGPEYIKYIKEYVEREIIFKEGSDIKSLYVINRGIVKIQKNLNGRSSLLCILGKGRLFGESSLFEGSKALYTAVALEESRLVVIDKNEFLKIFADDRNISFETLKQFNYNHNITLSNITDLFNKGEISYMIKSFLAYRLLRDGSNQSSEDLLVSKDLVSEMIVSTKSELADKIDILLKMNILRKVGTDFSLVPPQSLERSLAILNMKRKRTSKRI